MSDTGSVNMKASFSGDGIAFMDEDFLLKSPYAKRLYHGYAEKQPIVDYHCHINPREIYEDRHFENITQMWLGGDHYKWRLLRANAVDEKYITGNASDHDKFIEFAKVLEKAIGNPVHQWSHLELKKYFGYNKALNSKTAEEVWELCNNKLRENPDLMSARGIIKSSNVDVICTTDDPIDSLEWHEKIAEDKSFKTTVLPAWRPDKAVNIDLEEFTGYIKKLSVAAGIKIESLKDLYEALALRLKFFEKRGCLIADHGLTDLPDRVVLDEDEADRILKKALCGEKISASEANLYKLTLLKFFAKKYTEMGWVMQLHYGCKRNNNRKMFKRLGPDTGYDAILGSDNGERLAELLDLFSEEDGLPRTILYSLNPNDNAVIETVMGCFQDSSALCKMQHGSAWWFNDNRDGMEAQLKSLANEGVLGNFVGMLTDSRSFLSYTRHEYFRRILCNLIANFVENGEYEWDEEILGKMVSNISYYNALGYFGFNLKNKGIIDT